MLMTEMRAQQLRQDLSVRIDAIAQERVRMNPRQIVEGVDAIRALAQQHGFTAVSSLAGRLESALAREGSSGATLLCYLDALADAVKLEPMRTPAAQQALLASVALRLGH